jgi:sulfide:quinone oxidoreductase
MIRADSKCRVEGRPNVWVVGDTGSYPGPDWLPKQAHQADLQAKAVARNVKAALADREPTADFKPELICIVDMLDGGTVVYRSRRLNIVGPRTILFHWLKRMFEGYYLHAYR